MNLFEFCLLVGLVMAALLLTVLQLLRRRRNARAAQATDAVRDVATDPRELDVVFWEGFLRRVRGFGPAGLITVETANPARALATGRYAWEIRIVTPDEWRFWVERGVLVGRAGVLVGKYRPHPEVLAPDDDARAAARQAVPYRPAAVNPPPRYTGGPALREIGDSWDRDDRGDR